MEHLDHDTPRSEEHGHPDGPATPGRADGGRPAANTHPPLDEHHPVDLAAALRHARSPQRPGPDTPAGPAARAWPGLPQPFPRARPSELDLHALLRLSLAASDTTGRRRPTPSAGALHPVDTELVVGTGTSLPPGHYGYDPLNHRVHRLGPQPDGTPPGVTARLSVTPRRTMSHYGHRSWPLLLLDTGHAAAALYLAARALGCGEPELQMDEAAGSLLAAIHITPPSILPDPNSVRGTTDAPDPRELLTRRSSPPPLLGTPSTQALHAVLSSASHAGGTDLSWCAAVGPPQPRLVELAPDGETLRRRAAGEARPTLAVWAAGQGWVADAGAVLLAHGCPDNADTPHIRRAHLHAGFAVHLAHITARRHGLTARPVGSWQQADLGAALGSAPGQDWIIHALALGTHHAEQENSA
ncbi:nitroreductase family protein [Streptomyces zhihengii]